ncbi:hypothetical protein GQ53DRAFT_422008 [Thozetella sp. PMI_491]|nr:hypothetical protein GQ53DRAFT_422008 [Thozetella sp. PMI_491]
MEREQVLLRPHPPRHLCRTSPPLPLRNPPGQRAFDPALHAPAAKDRPCTRGPGPGGELVAVGWVIDFSIRPLQLLNSSWRVGAAEYLRSQCQDDPGAGSQHTSWTSLGR